MSVEHDHLHNPGDCNLMWAPNKWRTITFLAWTKVFEDEGGKNKDEKEDRNDLMEESG